MTTVVVNQDGAPSVTLDVSATAMARVSFSPSDRDTVKQVRILTAAAISIVERHAPTPPAGNVEEFIVAQLAAMDKAIAILNVV